jgi:hypothetical protein
MESDMQKKNQIHSETVLPALKGEKSLLSVLGSHVHPHPVLLLPPRSSLLASLLVCSHLFVSH